MSDKAAFVSGALLCAQPLRGNLFTDSVQTENPEGAARELMNALAGSVTEEKKKLNKVDFFIFAHKGDGRWTISGPWQC